MLTAAFVSVVLRKYLLGRKICQCLWTVQINHWCNYCFFLVLLTWWSSEDLLTGRQIAINWGRKKGWAVVFPTSINSKKSILLPGSPGCWNLFSCCGMTFGAVNDWHFHWVCSSIIGAFMVSLGSQGAEDFSEEGRYTTACATRSLSFVRN